MKIKKEFLNKKSLKPYGFKQEIIDAKRGIYEYTREDEYATTLIQRCDGVITIVMPNDEEGCGYYDSTNIPDVVYHLIKDGLVEAEELKKEFYQLDELSETACKKAVENTINFIIKQAAENYGAEGCNIPELIEHMRLKFDENGNIKE